MSLGFGEVACTRKGIMADYGKCNAFRYEPTKRKPEYARSPGAAQAMEEVTEEDFSIT